MSTYKIGYIVGSTSAASINRTLATVIGKLAGSDFEFVEIPIGDLPVYNRDFDADYPQAGKDLKAAIESADAVLIVTPEYNRGIPGALKNALDFASRPWGTNSFAGKPVAIAGASMGPIGSAVAQFQLRGTLGFLDAVVMGQPEAYIHLSEESIDAAPESRASLSRASCAATSPRSRRSSPRTPGSRATSTASRLLPEASSHAAAPRARTASRSGRGGLCAPGRSPAGR